MSRVKIDPILESHPRAADYMECQTCGADFEELILGGDGDWKRTIMCNKCMHIEENVPWEEVMLPLIAMAYGQTVEWARATEEQIDREYEEMRERHGIR